MATPRFDFEKIHSKDASLVYEISLYFLKLKNVFGLAAVESNIEWLKLFTLAITAVGLRCFSLLLWVFFYILLQHSCYMDINFITYHN